jgi:esterase/lipase superfamily enzyme
MRARHYLAVAASAALAAAGCVSQPELIVTPNLLVKQDPDRVFAACPACSQGPDMDVLYATDREAVPGLSGPSYTSDRGRHLAFGTATIALTPDRTWRELIADSTKAERRVNYELRPPVCKEYGAFDPRLNRLEAHEHGVQLCSAAYEDYRDQQRRFHSLLAERLGQSVLKDVFIFIHGVDNTFDDAILRAGEVWHFMGRVGVPVVYSWPAGYGGIRGYARDRESGEYTIFHLKCFLQMVASCPGVERIHLIAHSRGCDVAVTALRELHIAYHAKGQHTWAELKLENLVLAAPDLDQDVFMQRFVAENLIRAAKRTTIYTSTTDQMLELADFVFGGRRRLGALGPRDFSPQSRAALAKLPNLQFVDCKVTHATTTHDYVFSHPAALSDLILVLRERCGPGAANGRPLTQPVEGVWELTNDYLKR